jgi:F0F1-type ATP synthase delta subunit
MSTPSVELLKSVRTKSELDQLQSELGVLLKSIYKDKKTFKKVLDTEVTEAVREIVSEQLAVKADYKSLAALLEGYLNEAKQIKILRMTLAFEPYNDSISAIHEYIAQNMNTQIVLEFRYDPKIVGGAIIEYEGKFVDYSLRKKLDLYVKSQKDQLIKKIKKDGL